MKSKIVMKADAGDQPVRRESAAEVIRQAGLPILAVGIATFLVGWSDILISWFPFRIGNQEWEFSTISRTIDGMSLGTLGVCLIAIGAVMTRAKMVMRLALGLAAAGVALLLVAAGLYALTVPVAFSTADGAMRPLLRVAVLRTTWFLIIYLMLYGWLAWFFWKLMRRMPRPVVES